jgi:hypothetical protein
LVLAGQLRVILFLSFRRSVLNSVPVLRCHPDRAHFALRHAEAVSSRRRDEGSLPGLSAL